MNVANKRNTFIYFGLFVALTVVYLEILFTVYRLHPCVGELQMYMGYVNAKMFSLFLLSIPFLIIFRRYKLLLLFFIFLISAYCIGYNVNLPAKCGVDIERKIMHFDNSLPGISNSWFATFSGLLYPVCCIFLYISLLVISFAKIKSNQQFFRLGRLMLYFSFTILLIYKLLYYRLEYTLIIILVCSVPFLILLCKYYFPFKRMFFPFIIYIYILPAIILGMIWGILGYEEVRHPAYTNVYNIDIFNKHCINPFDPDITKFDDPDGFIDCSAFSKTDDDTQRGEKIKTINQIYAFCAHKVLGNLKPVRYMDKDAYNQALINCEEEHFEKTFPRRFDNE